MTSRAGTAARAVLAVAAVAGTLRVARRPDVAGLDATVGAFAARPRGAAVDTVAGAVTDVGSVFGLTGVVGTLLAAGERRLAVRTGIAGVAAWGIAQGTKELVERPRPYELGIAERLVSVPAGSSWPSGHSAVAAAMATTLAPSLTRAGRVGAVAAAATVAATRLYLGVHHATDVLAGAAIGVATADALRVVRGRVD